MNYWEVAWFSYNTSFTYILLDNFCPYFIQVLLKTIVNNQYFSADSFITAVNMLLYTSAHHKEMYSICTYKFSEFYSRPLSCQSYLFLYLSIILYIYLSIYSSIYLLIYLSIYSSIFLFIYLSKCVFRSVFILLVKLFLFFLFFCTRNFCKNIFYRWMSILF